MPRPILNVYGQDNPNESVIILGNRAGLMALQKAIKEARSQKRRGAVKATVSDGEEYELRVYRSTVSYRGRQYWKQLLLPYHETFRLQEGPTISPYELD